MFFVQLIIENVLWKNLSDKVNDIYAVSEMNKLHTNYKKNFRKIKRSEAYILSTKVIVDKIQNKTFCIQG